MTQIPVDKWMGLTDPRRMLVGLSERDDDEALKRDRYRQRHPSLFHDTSLDVGPIRKKKGATSQARKEKRKITTVRLVDSSVPDAEPLLSKPFSFEPYPPVTKKVSRRRYDILKALRTGEV